LFNIFLIFYNFVDLYIYFSPRLNENVAEKSTFFFPPWHLMFSYLSESLFARIIIMNIKLFLTPAVVVPSASSLLCVVAAQNGIKLNKDPY